MEFKERLKLLRKERKLTQSDLAEILNYGYTAISNYESGRNEPSISDLKKISVYFNVSLDYLLCMTDVRDTYSQIPEPEIVRTANSIFLDLSEEHKKETLHYMKFLSDMQEKEGTSFVRTARTMVAEPRTSYQSDSSQKETKE